MAGKISRKFEKLQRRENVAKRYLIGQSMRQIADSLELSLTTVFRDIEVTREEWRKNSVASISEHKAKELAKLDHLEMQAWQALTMSQGDVVITTERGRGKVAPPGSPPGTPGSPTEVTKQTMKKKSAGDARFMKIIFECIRQRCVIIGLNNPLPVSVGDYMPVVGFEIVQPVAALECDTDGDGHAASTEAAS